MKKNAICLTLIILVLTITNFSSYFAIVEGKRLRTEAEWEYAARGGQNTKGYKYSFSKGSKIATFREKWVFLAFLYASWIAVFRTSAECRVYEWCNDWWGSYSSAVPTVCGVAAVGAASRSTAGRKSKGFFS